MNRKRSGKLVDKVEANIQIEYHKYPSYSPGHLIILFRAAHAGENEINAKPSLSSQDLANIQIMQGKIRNWDNSHPHVSQALILRTYL